VFDDSQSLIAHDDDDIPKDSLNSVVVVSVVAGRTYYVQASGFGATTGRYELLFNDDVPNDFADASLIRVDSKLLSATVFGTIEVRADVDMYRFVAPVTGPRIADPRRDRGPRVLSRRFDGDCPPRGPNVSVLRSPSWFRNRKTWECSSRLRRRTRAPVGNRTAFESLVPNHA